MQHINSITFEEDKAKAGQSWGFKVYPKQTGLSQYGPLCGRVEDGQAFVSVTDITEMLGTQAAPASIVDGLNLLDEVDAKIKELIAQFGSAK